MNPRNVGALENPDGVGTVGNPKCGDIMTMTIRVKDDVLEDVRFQTFGCGAAIATSSICTEMAKGKPLSEVEKISREAIAEALGGLPALKMHCSNLASDALMAAVDDYRKHNNGGKKESAPTADDGTRVPRECPLPEGEAKS